MLRLKKIVYSYLVFDSLLKQSGAQTDIGFNGQVLRPAKLIRT